MGVKARSPMVCRISCATCTSRVRSPPGSGVSEMRIVSPMPSCSSTDSAAVEATMPFDPMPASVSPRCSADHRLAHHLVGFERLGAQCVFVHHARQQLGIQAAPVDADAYRLFVAQRALD